MVAVLGLDSSGKGVRERFTAAVIRSHARLDYPGGAGGLSRGPRGAPGGAREHPPQVPPARGGGARARYREHLPQIQRLRDVAARMRALSLQRGALDFDLPEAKVLLDEDDATRVRDVVRARATPEVREAYRLVEDCMLAANEAV